MTQNDYEQMEQVVREFSIAYLERLRWQAGQLIPGVDMKFGLDITTENVFERVMEAQDWRLLAKAAAGMLTRNNDNVGYVHDVAQGLAEWLYAVPGTYQYTIPDSWWETEMGAIHMAALVWCQGDDLITQAEAAELAGVTVQAINNATRDGRLRGYANPTATNKRKGGTLVSKARVIEVYNVIP